MKSDSKKERGFFYSIKRTSNQTHFHLSYLIFISDIITTNTLQIYPILSAFYCTCRSKNRKFRSN